MWCESITEWPGGLFPFSACTGEVRAAGLQNFSGVLPLTSLRWAVSLHPSHLLQGPMSGWSHLRLGPKAPPTFS